MFVVQSVYDQYTAPINIRVLSLGSPRMGDVWRRSMRMHMDTILRPEDLGTRIPPYQPNFDFSGKFIDIYHQGLAEAPTKGKGLVQIRSRRWFRRLIPGWLRREDALKLYELSYFTTGDILELGPHHGLSTSILAQAARCSGC